MKPAPLIAPITPLITPDTAFIVVFATSTNESNIPVNMDLTPFHALSQSPVNPPAIKSMSPPSIPFTFCIIPAIPDKRLPNTPIAPDISPVNAVPNTSLRKIPVCLITVITGSH